MCARIVFLLAICVSHATNGMYVSSVTDRTFDLDTDTEICNGGTVLLRVIQDTNSVVNRGVFNDPIAEYVTVLSRGNINNGRGNCTVTFTLPRTTKCDAICVNVTKFNDTSGNTAANLTLTPAMSGRPDRCVDDSRQVQLTIQQSAAYTAAVVAGTMQSQYEYGIAFFARCQGNNGTVVELSNEDSELTDLNEPMTSDNLVHGVVTAVMLAFGWLLVFIFFKCYYKHMHFGGKRFYTPPKTEETGDGEGIQMTTMK